MSKVFLGGTWNESTWRDTIISYFKELGVEYFNPIVDDWTEEAQANELIERKNCAISLYTITPRITGLYSIAELVDDSNKKPFNTVMIILETDGDLTFNYGQLKSLKAVANLVELNGSSVFYDLENASIHISML